MLLEASLLECPALVFNMIGDSTIFESRFTLPVATNSAELEQLALTYIGCEKSTMSTKGKDRMLSIISNPSGEEPIEALVSGLISRSKIAISPQNLQPNFGTLSLIDRLDPAFYFRGYIQQWRDKVNAIYRALSKC